MIPRDTVPADLAPGVQYSHGMTQSDISPEEFDLVVGPAPFNAHEGISQLLETVGLPVPGHADVPVQMMAAFAGPHLVGCVGWESFGPQALLRSLAVQPSMRGQGVGQVLVDCLLDVMAGMEVEEVYLLTTEAAGFFTRFGFEAVERSSVPEPVHGSGEFALDCCQTAVVMKRNLADREVNA